MQFSPRNPDVIQRCIYLLWIRWRIWCLVSGSIFFSSFVFFFGYGYKSHIHFIEVVITFMFSFSSVIKSVPAHYVCSFHKLTIPGNWTRQIKSFLNHSHLFVHSHVSFPICIVYVVRISVHLMSAPVALVLAKFSCRKKKSFSNKELRKWHSRSYTLK